MLSLITAILKAFPALADLIGNAIDMLREQKAQQRHSQKDAGVDAYNVAIGHLAGQAITTGAEKYRKTDIEK